MFCPQCNAEYRPGFTRCADCDVDLVAELPKPNEDWGGFGPLSHVWTGHRQQRCLEICKELKALEIPYSVEQSRLAQVRDVEEHYRISVPKQFVEKARRIVKGDL